MSKGFSKVVLKIGYDFGSGCYILLRLSCSLTVSSTFRIRHLLFFERKVKSS
jgi:hypothetical protein